MHKGRIYFTPSPSENEGTKKTLNKSSHHTIFPAMINHNVNANSFPCGYLRSKADMRSTDISTPNMALSTMVRL